MEEQTQKKPAEKEKATPSEKPVALLFSGDPASLIAHRMLAKEGREVTWVEASLGSQAEELQRQATGVFREQEPKPLELVKLAVLTVSGVPAHLVNYHLLGLAASVAKEIYIPVFQSERDSPSCNSWFFTRLARTFEGLDPEPGKYRILTPFGSMTLVDAVQWFLLNGGEAGVLRKTWSCQSPVNKGTPEEPNWLHCGACTECFERWIGFSYNGMTSEWDSEPKQWAGAEKYLAETRERLRGKAWATQIDTVLRIK